MIKFLGTLFIFLSTIQAAAQKPINVDQSPSSASCQAIKGRTFSCQKDTKPIALLAGCDDDLALQLIQGCQRDMSFKLKIK